MSVSCFNFIPISEANLEGMKEETTGRDKSTAQSETPKALARHDSKLLSSSSLSEDSPPLQNAPVKAPSRQPSSSRRLWIFALFTLSATAYLLYILSFGAGSANSRRSRVVKNITKIDPIRRAKQLSRTLVVPTRTIYISLIFSLAYSYALDDKLVYL